MDKNLQQFQSFYGEMAWRMERYRTFQKANLNKSYQS